MRSIFIIGMPRAGSTLLNRLLASHSDIASHSEPWIMLPLTHMNKAESVEASYSHTATSRAVGDIINTLNGSSKTWNKHIYNFATNIYKSLAEADSKKEAIYFIDKTPRYHLIVNELSEIFTDAKFIILVRNPISCLASGINTWANGSLKIHGQLIDLIEGPKNIAHALTTLGDRAHKVSYEDLIEDTPLEIKKIYHFLNLTHDIDMPVKQAKLNGAMGDPLTTTENTETIARNKVSKYKKTFGTAYRKWFVKRYLSQLNADDLQIMGYSKSKLMQDINKLPNSLQYLFKDVFTEFSANIWRILDIGYLRKRMRAAKNKQKLYIHN